MMLVRTDIVPHTKCQTLNLEELPTEESSALSVAVCSAYHKLRYKIGKFVLQSLHFIRLNSKTRAYVNVKHSSLITSGTQSVKLCEWKYEICTKGCRSGVWRNNTACEMWSIQKADSLVGSDTVSACWWLRMFYRNTINMRMEAVCLSETVVTIYKTTRCYKPEDNIQREYN